jgi:CrcB protein
LIALSIGVSAALGALLRWQLGIYFNPLFPTLPLGTLAANLLGGFLMGLAMELIAMNVALPPAVRLAMTTGFLGGLTTFSTFSAETVTLLLRKQYWWPAGEVVIHVTGSVALTIVGVLCVRGLWSWATAG